MRSCLTRTCNLMLQAKVTLDSAEQPLWKFAYLEQQIGLQSKLWIINCCSPQTSIVAKRETPSSKIPCHRALQEYNGWCWGNIWHMLSFRLVFESKLRPFLNLWGALASTIRQSSKTSSCYHGVALPVFFFFFFFFFFMLPVFISFLCWMFDWDGLKGHPT